MVSNNSVVLKFSLSRDVLNVLSRDVVSQSCVLKFALSSDVLNPRV